MPKLVYVVLVSAFLSGCGGGGGGDKSSVQETREDLTDFEVISGVEIDEIKAGSATEPYPLESVFLAVKEMFIDTYGQDIIDRDLFHYSQLMRRNELGNDVVVGYDITFRFFNPSNGSTTVMIDISLEPRIFAVPASDTVVSL